MQFADPHASQLDIITQLKNDMDFTIENKVVELRKKIIFLGVKKKKIRIKSKEVKLCVDCGATFKTDDTLKVFTFLSFQVTLSNIRIYFDFVKLTNFTII